MSEIYTLAADEGATPQAYAKRASEHLLQMTSALAYDGALYVLAGTAEAPYRVFSATSVDTAAQPGDYVAPDPEPEPTPEGNGGSDSGAAGETLKKLANTGDGLAAPIVLLGVALGAAGVLAAVARKRSGRS